MNKKFTLLATAFLTISAFAANAKVEPADYTAGNYYYLKAADKYLSLDGNRADSVIVKDITTSLNKASRDSALWEITKAGEETAGIVYQFKNKKTKQLLSFPASSETAVLGDGFNKWAISATGKISTNAGKMILAISDGEKATVVFNTTGTAFTIEKPDTMRMSAQDLGDGFSTFQLNFADTYTGNIFTGKDLIAQQAGNDGFVTLQVKGDESYSNGVKKYLGVDTLKTTINNAEGVFGAKFSNDSIRETVKPNERCKQFKFIIDLQNDSLSMFIAGAPNVNGDLATLSDTVRVVYAQTADTKVLTVADTLDGKPKQGVLPFITVSRGTPATISTGTGVYFLKVANKNANNGKYLISNIGGIKVFGNKPSVKFPQGQWYIKEKDGKYSIVDRKENSSVILNDEVFAVQGMENTYTFAGSQDSITVELQTVDLKDKYLGTLSFTEKELADNGYVLNLIPGAFGAANLYAFTTDTVLKGKVGDGKDATVFKLISAGTLDNSGAKSLGDTLYSTLYKFKALYNNDSVAIQRDSLKLSKFTEATAFTFVSDAKGEKYMMMSDDKYVGMNNSTACLQITSDVSYVTLEAVDAPEYGSFDNNHKRFSYNNNSLVMNPYTLLAEMKVEGNEIATKAGYTADNFSLWVEKANIAEGKQLYFISSGMTKSDKATDPRYYLAAKDTLGGRAVFMSNDTIKTQENSPALFAFKISEDGGYYLENQTQLAKTSDAKPYVGVLNGFAVMQSEPSAAFALESASAPTSNDQISTLEGIRVIGGTGEVIISNASGKKISVSNILGQSVGSRKATSDYYTMPASKGILLVTIEGDNTYKVVVK